MSKDHWHDLPCSVGSRVEGGAVWVVGGVKSSELTSAPARPALSLVDHRTMPALIGQQRWSVAAGWWREGRPSPCSLCLSYKAHEQLQHLHKIFERTAACTYEKESSNSLRIALITVPTLILTLALLVIIMWSIFNTVFIFLVRILTRFPGVFASFERVVPISGLLLPSVDLGLQTGTEGDTAWVEVHGLLGQDSLQEDDQGDDQGGDSQEAGLLKCSQCDRKILLKSACGPETNWRGKKNTQDVILQLYSSQLEFGAHHHLECPFIIFFCQAQTKFPKCLP